MSEVLDKPELNDKVIRMAIESVRIPDLDFVPMEPGLFENVLIHKPLRQHGRRSHGLGRGPDQISTWRTFIPLHLHRGYEMVLVLQGEYIENGETPITRAV